MDSSNIECPHCQTIGESRRKPRWRHINQLTLVMGGILLPTLWDAGRKTEFTCTHCEQEFKLRSEMAKISLACFWIFIAMIAAGMLCGITL